MPVLAHAWIPRLGNGARIGQRTPLFSCTFGAIAQVQVPTPLEFYIDTAAPKYLVTLKKMIN